MTKTARLTHFELAPKRRAGEARRLIWLDRVEELGVRVARASGLDDDEAQFLGLAVREALMNALTHGNSDRVAVSFRLTEGDSLVITVRDHGPGFDPARIPNPLSEDNLAKSSGRGIFYMRRFADEVVFAFPSRGGTVARLFKRLSSPRG
jgi:serine/threonine-protein kinase RsbW